MISIGFIIEVILLAIALSMDCFTVSITCGLQKCMCKKRSLLLAFCFGIFHVLMPTLGTLLGEGFHYFMENFDHWIAFVLLTIIGIKMIMEGRQFKLKEKIFDISSIKVILTLALATSMDAFIVGIGFPLKYTFTQILVALAIIFVTLFTISLIGIKMGERVRFIKPRFALFLGGIILIGIGVKTLLEHTCF
ncbi:MAG: manganese efflux pump [Bacteroidales bacterium]|nr:manganese efflux pump [Bacteroidales bacterium]MEE1225624.1 manganese efflux pump [Bacteroidales bacterium]